MTKLTPTELMLRQREELIDALADCVAQSCTTDDGELDSMALSTYADALRLLQKWGRVEVTSEYGRRVIARWTPTP